MNEEINDEENIRELFHKILGEDIIVKDNMDASEESIFITFIEKLKSSYDTENELYNVGGITLEKITDPLWFVLENTFKFLYGGEATELILWYIFDRITPEGEVIPLEDENENKIIFNNSQELWKYIRFNFLKKD
jgi:hypothetical protein